MERWQKNLYILWISQIISLTSFGFGLPFLPFYIQELGVTDPAILKLYTGILSGAPAVTMAIMAPVWGFLSDRYGRKLMIQRAMLAAVFIIGLMGAVGQVWQLLVLRLLQGLFTGTITASSTFVAANTPNNKLSYALGFLSSSTFIGYSLGPVMGGFVAEHFGYRISFFTGAFLMLLGFCFITFWLSEDKSLLKKATLKPLKSQKRPMLYGQILTVNIMLMLLMLFFQRITRSVFSPFIPLYIQELQNSKEGVASMTGYVNGFIGFMTTIAAISISRLGDRYNKFNMITLLLGFAILDALLLNLSHSLLAFIGLYGVLFLLIGGIEPMITSMTAEATLPENRGSLFGLQGLIGSLGWIVSPTLGTYISIYAGIKNILWVILVMLILNLSVISIIKLKNERDKYE